MNYTLNFSCTSVFYVTHTTSPDSLLQEKFAIELHEKAAPKMGKKLFTLLATDCTFPAEASFSATSVIKCGQIFLQSRV